MDNNIFKFILDYLKSEKIDKKYKGFLNNYNVYNLFKLAINSYYNFIIDYLNLNNFNCDHTEIFRNLVNLEIRLRKIYKIRKRKTPTFNLFIFTF